MQKDICVGTISLVENDLQCRPHYTPWLASLFVPEEYRKQGIGEQLIEHIKGLAREMGYNKIYLRTEDAETYYQRLNWQYIETCADDVFDLVTHVFAETTAPGRPIS
jgi:predicted N-acetyltransferase YhbS